MRLQTLITFRRAPYSDAVEINILNNGENLRSFVHEF